jgi:hypothetical protein
LNLRVLNAQALGERTQRPPVALVDEREEDDYVCGLHHT